MILDYDVIKLNMQFFLFSIWNSKSKIDSAYN